MTCAMSYVLNVEAVILRIAERCIHRVNNEVLTAFVTEPNEQFHCMTGWEICPTSNIRTLWFKKMCQLWRTITTTQFSLF